MGQSNAFRDTRFDLHRGNVIRKGRNAIHRNFLQVYPSSESYSRPISLFILVLPKINPGFQNDILWGESMCADIEKLVHVELNMPFIPVMCAHGGSLPLSSEISLVQASPLIIAEHGSVSIPAAVYANDDTVVVAIGEKRHIKCAYLNRIPYIHLLFAIIEERETTLPGIVQYAIHLAAKNFNFPLK